VKFTDFMDSQRDNDPGIDTRIQAEKLRVDLAVAIARRREAKGLSQNHTAQMAYLTQQQISRIENAENCNIDTYFKAMVALEMEFSDLTIQPDP
jgi:ribosome-binding protein aMBF1 (putative translation factor)